MGKCLEQPFKDAVGPLSTAEKESLEDHIKRTGRVLFPIVITTDREIIDGHHRYEIATRLSIPFDTVELPESKDWTQEHKRWQVEQYALATRNLSPDQKREINESRNDRIKAKRKAGWTQAKIAKHFGISQRHVSRVAADIVDMGSIMSAPGTVRDATTDARVKLLPESKEEIAKRLAEGASTEQLAADFGVSQRQMRRIKATSQAASESKSAAEPPAEPDDIFLPASPPEPKPEAPHVSRNSGIEEWYTPAHYINAARTVMGDIDLDPASSDNAQPLVDAAKYYTIDDDGLSQPWAGRVWMNPPYTSGLIDAFMERLHAYVDAGDVTQAVVLVNNSTDTKWFHDNTTNATAFCFPLKRIRFLDPNGVEGKPLQGQVFIYYGDNHGEFCEVFSSFGLCVLPAATEVV